MATDFSLWKARFDPGQVHMGFMKDSATLRDFHPNPSVFLSASSISGVHTPITPFTIDTLHLIIAIPKKKIKRTASRLINFEDMTLHYSYMLKIDQDVALHKCSFF
jgi:hypothetical protein